MICHYLGLKSFMEFLGFVYLFQLILNYIVVYYLQVLGFGGVIFDYKCMSFAFLPMGTLAPDLKRFFLFLIFRKYLNFYFIFLAKQLIQIKNPNSCDCLEFLLEDWQVFLPFPSFWQVFNQLIHWGCCPSVVQCYAVFPKFFFISCYSSKPDFCACVDTDARLMEIGIFSRANTITLYLPGFGLSCCLWPPTTFFIVLTAPPCIQKYLFSNQQFVSFPPP